MSSVLRLIGWPLYVVRCSIVDGCAVVSGGLTGSGAGTVRPHSEAPHCLRCTAHMTFVDRLVRARSLWYALNLVLDSPMSRAIATTTWTYWKCASG